MSGSAARWREEQILVICPGSRTTMAQLGCNELTPPVHRMPTRMFLDPEDGGWRPYHTFKRRKGGKKAGVEQNGDEEKANGDEDEWEWVEDQDSEEGAVYPMQAGRIVNMPAFLAFLDHIHSLLTTTYHNTPIVLMASPQWTRDCVEEITQFIFEKTKTPALCLIHSAIATQYGLRWPNMTVVDIGFEKVDVTCIFDGAVMNHQAIGVAYGDDDGIQSGGEVFTRKLLALLEGKGFNYDMAEQLKKSTICEVLPYAADLPDRMELPKANAETAGLPPSSNPAADAAKVADSARAIAPADEDEMEVEDKIVADGVLDVAAIVTTGQTKEFLAKKEKEKAKSAKKTAANEAQASRIARLPNSKRTHNIFHYEEVVQEEVPKAKPAPAVPSAPAAAPADAATTENGTAKPETAEGEKPAAEEATKEGPEGEKSAAEEPAKQGDEAVKTEAAQPTEKPEGPETAPPAAEPAAEQPPRPDSPVETELQAKLVRRDIEVGLERFRFADRDQIDRITTLIWKTIQGVPDMFMRPACWDHIAIVGNGSRVRGLRENIIQTLTARHLISPSSATIFTSELPSNMATPTGTGSQTPTGSFTGTPHQLPPTASSVNPLLQAATTATLNGPIPGQQPLPGGAPGSEAGVSPSHRFHSQTPTSIKLAPLPTYLAEWSKNGYEEAMFLGAQVAGRIAFCLHNLDGSSSEAQRRMSLSRVEYNEIGPKGVRKHSMLQ
ncbi:related to actin-related protein [Cephalotrichum gorgonifer]|uniref:Related to actin-related protein n=1 Tax=Cephalotrichum gorgonifer TaxID=2041049 RepID=A0AAE8N3Y2_9PEZI|nr:related to actin-related protein [Cephalotrichum gorgonifer]